MKTTLETNLKKQCCRGLAGILGMIFLLSMSPYAFSKTITVDSLETLLPLLERDHVDVKMKPGTYHMTAEECSWGLYGKDNIQGMKVLLLFSGSNSTYDFTDVTIHIETAVFKAFGNKKIYELNVVGNKNLIRNLTITDIGSVNDAPAVGVIGVVIDGVENRLERLSLSTKGSYPYGYGDAFGKAGTVMVGKNRKHSAFLLRGTRNHVKDCRIIHRGFGHALAMQACESPTIEGCYIEGQMRSTDDMLAEEGTGSVGDKVDFMTCHGYRLPPGYMMALTEEGIRAYNTGNTIIDGQNYSRGTSDITILDCTVKNCRGGVTITHGTGKKFVKGTTVIGCERGFCIGSGDLVDCYADCQYGPALGVDFSRDSGMNAEITLMPYEGASYNGSGQAAIIVGSHHNVIFKSTVPNPDQNLKIEIGGDNRMIGGWLQKDENYSAKNISIENHTTHPVVLDDNSSNCTGVSGGVVTDFGQNNKIKRVRVKN